MLKKYNTSADAKFKLVKNADLQLGPNFYFWCPPVRTRNALRRLCGSALKSLCGTQSARRREPLGEASTQPRDPQETSAHGREPQDMLALEMGALEPLEKSGLETGALEPLETSTLEPLKTSARRLEPQGKHAQTMHAQTMHAQGPQEVST